MDKFTTYYSASVLGCGNNNGIHLKENCEYVFKSYYKLKCDGENVFRLFFVNSVESTGNCRIGKSGDGYEITEAYAALSRDEDNEYGKTTISFDGNRGIAVEPGQAYKTDEFLFTYDKECYMVLSFTIKTTGRKFLPATEECAAKGRVFENGNELYLNNFTLRPAFIGIKKLFEKTVGFWGDSITQGARTGVDKYEAWTHRIGNYLNENISFWNIGMGWARAYDASEGGVFFKKAAMCDEVFICFGVNDIKSGGRTGEEIIRDLEKTQSMLYEANRNIVIHMLTVPPFNMTEYEEAQRKKVNEYILKTKSFFDIAAVLEDDDRGSVKKEYMSPGDDAHPSGVGGEAVFNAFLKWSEETGW